VLCWTDRLDHIPCATALAAHRQRRGYNYVVHVSHHKIVVLLDMYCGNEGILGIVGQPPKALIKYR